MNPDPHPGPAAREEPLVVRADDGRVRLPGTLARPTPCDGLVIFAHGSGSSRHSPRNRFVAEVLQRRGLATLLFDLLTPEEAADRRNVFDIDRLGARTVDALDAVRARDDLAPLPIGLFGASTGAAAALCAAAARPAVVRAVVSRGGRPDLAMEVLAAVRAPTLLVVGGRDDVVLDLNRQALAALGDRGTLRVVDGATHLFEEPGTLEIAADVAADWFARHLAGVGSAAG